MQLPIDEDKWINYIINTESKLKDHFKVPEMRTKFQKNNLIVFAQLVHKTITNNTPKFRPILSAMNSPTYLLAEY